MMDVERLPLVGQGSLVEVLSSVVDPRKRRGVRHPVGYVVALAVCAMLCGCSSFVTIGEWASRQPWHVLQRLGAKRRKAPSVSTFRRILMGMDPVLFEQRVGRWWRALISLAGEALALDGKSLRGARREGSAPHLVSALVHRLGIVVAECRVADKSNEITSVEPLLEEVDIAGAVVTGDAMFTQKKIADYLVRRRADYLFTVKDNQPTLKADIETLRLECAPPSNGYR